MKNTLLFKRLIDMLFFLHLLGIIAIVFTLPFGILDIDQNDIDIKDWSLLYWFNSIASLAIYLIFLRGLFYLRQMATSLLSKNYFSEMIITNLNKSGSHFVLCGILSFALILLLWISKLLDGKFVLSLDSNLIIPLFLLIIGLFFIIQSKTLYMAKDIKEENELTV